MGAVIHQLKKPVHPDVVRYLEEALEKARAGETTGVMILERDAEGVSYATAGLEDRFVILGWLSHALYKLQGDGDQ